MHWTRAVPATARTRQGPLVLDGGSSIGPGGSFGGVADAKDGNGIFYFAGQVVDGWLAFRGYFELNLQEMHTGLHGLKTCGATFLIGADPSCIVYCL